MNMDSIKSIFPLNTHRFQTPVHAGLHAHWIAGICLFQFRDQGGKSSRLLSWVPLKLAGHEHGTGAGGGIGRRRLVQWRQCWNVKVHVWEEVRLTRWQQRINSVGKLSSYSSKLVNAGDDQGQIEDFSEHVGVDLKEEFNWILWKLKHCNVQLIELYSLLYQIFIHFLSLQTLCDLLFSRHLSIPPPHSAGNHKLFV